MRWLSTTKNQGCRRMICPDPKGVVASATMTVAFLTYELSVCANYGVIEEGFSLPRVSPRMVLMEARFCPLSEIISTVVKTRR